MPENYTARIIGDSLTPSLRAGGGKPGYVYFKKARRGVNEWEVTCTSLDVQGREPG